MDVPVSIALIVTFFASLYATISGQGETYYDSVSMFVFFLLAGRYIEHNARLKAANMANDLVVVEPTLVQRVGNESALVQQIDQANIAHHQSVEQKIETAEHALSLTEDQHQKLAQLGELIHSAKRSRQSEQQDVQQELNVNGESDLSLTPQKL